ncbi:MAG: hypothetical protein ACRDY4_05090 [Acidimicrobiia bacterium]
MFTETRSSLARVRLKEQLAGLQSFEPADRARAGRELAADLARSAGPLLDHVANEFDDRVLTAIARAVVDTPPEPRESRRVRQLREWADSELERLALEEAFLGREPQPVGRVFDFAPVAASDTAPESPQLTVAEVAPAPVALTPRIPPEKAEPKVDHHISWRAPDDDAPDHPASATDHPANGWGTETLSWRP